jgi:hypothetical protein
LQYIFYYLAPSSLPTRNTKVALTKLSWKLKSTNPCQLS